ncbi:GNAT family N-acetyltransferase [Candidatus Saccharibacteria bacterium]|nr:GNAT family N-acetyltransferase [Candidatus Saccharibacteria bacterium]
MGIGSLLLQNTLDWHGTSEDIYLHVVSYNERAIRLYEKYGFEKTGIETPEQYDDNRASNYCQK